MRWRGPLRYPPYPLLPTLIYPAAGNCVPTERLDSVFPRHHLHGQTIWKQALLLFLSPSLPRSGSAHSALPRAIAPPKTRLTEVSEDSRHGQLCSHVTHLSSARRGCFSKPPPAASLSIWATSSPDIPSRAQATSSWPP